MTVSPQNKCVVVYGSLNFDKKQEQTTVRVDFLQGDTIMTLSTF